MQASPLRHAPHPGAARFGFTLVEMVLVLAILAVLAGAAVPSFIGLRREKEAREPIEALAKLAKETRLRAMREKRPYQIAMTSTAFTATRYFSPYMQAAQLEELLQKAALEAEQKEEAGLNEADGAPPASPMPIAGQEEGALPPPPPPVFKEWSEKVTLPEGVTCSVKYWYEGAPVALENNAVRLWVFQPTGIVTPLTVTVNYEEGQYSASFSALTADLVEEAAP